jgi:hypothetical protein
LLRTNFKSQAVVAPASAPPKKRNAMEGPLRKT